MKDGFRKVMNVLSGATIIGSFGLMAYGWCLERKAKKALDSMDHTLYGFDDSSDDSEEDIDDSEKEEG